MKKNNKRILALAITLSLCLGAVIGAGAISTLVDIKAQLNYGITVEYDGEAKTLTDATGAEVVPITYNGTTYLPVRAIANLLSIPVGWDGTTQTVELGDTGDGVDMIDTCLPYYQTNDRYRTFNHVQTSDKNNNQPMGIGNISHWVYMRLYGRGPLIASYDLGGRYSTLSFKYLITVDGSGESALEILGDDGTNLSTIEIVGGQVVHTATITLRNTKDLSFRLSSDNSYRHIHITLFDVTLK